MRDISPEVVDVLNGSRSGDRLIVNAWRAGELLAENLPVSEWSLSGDFSAEVQQQLSVTITDAEGSLAPWSVTDPLGIGGSELQVSYEVGGTGEVVDLGWFRISRSAPKRAFRTMQAGTQLVWLSTGSSIPVEADDLTAVAVRDRLLSAESPPTGATVLSEVERLLDGIVTVEVAEGIADRSVPASTIYEEERMGAVADLLGLIGCTYRMTGDGTLEVISLDPQEPVWTVAGGPDGALVSIDIEQDIEGLYNAVVSRGQTADGTPMQAVAMESGGPLAFDGPVGRIPMFRESPLVSSQAALEQDAITTLDNRIVSRSVVLDVTCLPHPGLQVGDWVTLVQPEHGSTEGLPLVGRIERYTLSGKAAVAPMTLGVAVSLEDIERLANG